MLIDSHAHIYDEKMAEWTKNLYSNMKNSYLDTIIVPSCDDKSMEQAFNLANEFNKIYCALGVHPHDAKNYTALSVQYQTENANNKKVVAIGEIGLDYFYNFSPRQTQIEVFDMQIELANKLDLPIIFHVRDAFDDFFAVLKNNMCKKGLVHCFCGDKAIAKKALDMGLMLGFTCNITYKNSQGIQEAGQYAPLDRILLETDSPYLSPKDKRKEVNTPSNVHYVADELAVLKGIDFHEIADQTTKNVFGFFNKIDKGML